MPDQSPSEVNFYFEFDPNYRLETVNGAWGGITPRGDIKIDFFVESFSIPSVVTQSVGSDGKLGDPIRKEPEDKIVRKIKVGVMMSPSQAKSLSEFIKTKVNELEEIDRQRQK